MDCIVCRKPSKEALILETKYWNATLAEDQYYLGRSYVSLKRHAGSLSELSSEEWIDFTELVKRLEKALRKAFGATLFNWGCLMNNAFREKPANPHVHWHFRPRYQQKVEFEGLIFEDNEFGEHYARGAERKLPAEIFVKISEKIMENL